MNDAPILLNDNGAWCWFQDERALIDPANNTETEIVVSLKVAGPDA